MTGVGNGFAVTIMEADTAPHVPFWAVTVYTVVVSGDTVNEEPALPFHV